MSTTSVITPVPVRKRVGVVLVALGLVIAGCSSTAAPSGAPSTADQQPSIAPATPAASAAATPAASGSDLKAAAAALVNQAMGPTQWVSPGDPIDASSIKGKTLWIISADLSIPFHQNIVKGFQEAATAAGLLSQTFDGKGQQQEASRGIDQAISSDAGGIALLSISPSFQAGALQRATDAKIPVIGMLTTSSEHEPWPGTAGEATYSYYKSGQLLGAYAIANTDGPVHALYLDVSEFKELSFLKKGIYDSLAQFCGADCTVEYSDMLVATFKAQAQTLTPSQLARFPETNWIFPAFDAMALFVVPSVEAAGSADKVRVGSINAVNTNLQFILDGKVQAVDAGIPNSWMGWGGVDRLMRAMLGAPALTSEVPIRLFDKTNLQGIDVNDEVALHGGFDYRSEYKKLWGVQ